MKKRSHPDDCPCGSSHSYADCCGRWHAGTPAPTAEALMRSRYAAYVLHLNDYLLATWHARTRPAAETLTENDDGSGLRWLGLEVKHHAATGDDSAIIEFIARYRSGGRGHRLHETSRFVREDNCWYYVDGDLH